MPMLPVPFGLQGLDRLMAGLLDDPTFSKPSILIPLCCSMFCFSITCGFAVLHAWASAAFSVGSSVVSMVFALSLWKLHSFSTRWLVCLLVFGASSSVIGLFGIITCGTLGHANDEGVLSITSRNISAFWAFFMSTWALALVWVSLRNLRRKLYKEKCEQDRT